MICERNECKRPFAPGQTVFVVVNDDGIPVNCCSEDCAAEEEKNLRQQEMFKDRQKRVFVIDSVTNGYCHLAGVTATEGKDGMKTVLKIELSAGASIDRIMEFRGGPVTLELKLERLDEVPVETEELEPHTLEHSLYHALYHKDGAGVRWTDRIEKGLSDGDLKAAIIYEFGVEGFLSNEIVTACAFEVAEGRSGQTPKFWYADAPTNAKPTLEGKALVKVVRDLLKVPVPQHKEQAA